MTGRHGFGWLQIARMGLVQAALGAVVVLTTSTLNRVMVVELMLPALLPGVLVALHYGVQLARPRMGYGSDVGGRRTPWILGGMAVLASGGVLAALATVWMSSQPVPAMVLAVLAFMLIGLGVSASGTSLLVMLAKRVHPHRRAGAATLVWVMMIAGFAITAGVAGYLLEPYSPQRLLAVTAGVCVCAFVLAVGAMWGLEGHPDGDTADGAVPSAPPPFLQALSQVWQEPVARRFTIFVFVSMLAYSAQDLILEPFAGQVFGYSPGASTQLSGVQHGGVLLGMLMVAAAGAVSARWGARHPLLSALGSLQGWTVGGCVASALALFGLVGAGLSGGDWPLRQTVFLLGVANGAFSIGAIGSMMRLASVGRHAREGVRMGLWGAAQAISFGVGGLVGTAASDVARGLIASPGAAYASVFALEGSLFLLSAVLALYIAQRPSGAPSVSSRHTHSVAPPQALSHSVDLR